MAMPDDVAGAPIERQSETPYYQQLSDALESRLASGEIKPDSRLPSESQLCAEFGLSRATVRHALRHLEARGMVYRIANRGVFAGNRHGQHGWVIQNAEGFLENAITHQNRSVTTNVVRSGYQVLPAFAAEELGLPAGTQGFELVRVRYLDGQATVFSTNYLPPSVAGIVESASDALNGTASLSQLLHRSGYVLAGANRFVRAVMATPEIAAALGISAHEPLLQVRSTSWRADGSRFDVYETYVRTDIVPLEINVRAL